MTSTPELPHLRKTRFAKVANGAGSLYENLKSLRMLTISSERMMKTTYGNTDEEVGDRVGVLIIIHVTPNLHLEHDAERSYDESGCGILHSGGSESLKP